ncbi:MAG: hypothetical protein R3B55_00370 [Candidatus Paceibacterota bacterium]
MSMEGMQKINKEKLSTLERVRARLKNSPEKNEIRESIRKIASGVERISNLMEEKGMSKLNLAYSLLQGGFGHKFVQDYLDNGSFVFFDEKGEHFDEIKFDKILKFINNFNF